LLHGGNKNITAPQQLIVYSTNSFSEQFTQQDN